MSARLGFAALVLLLAVPLGYLAAGHPGIALGVAALGAVVALLPFFAPFRAKVERTGSAPVAPELIALPLLLEGRVFTGDAFAAVLLLGLIAYLATVRTTQPALRPLVLGAVVVSFVLVHARPIGSESALAGLAVPTLCLALLAMSARRRTLQSFVTSLIDGVGLYLLANIGAYYAGLVSPTASMRTGALDALGGGVRIIFPISSSLATPAAMAAIYIAGAAICLERSSTPRMLMRFLAFGAAAFVLVSASTRSAILVAAVLLVSSILSTRLLARVATAAAAFSVAFAFVFVSIQALVGFALSGLLTVMPQFSRGGFDADVTLNFRSFIWGRTLHFWSEYVDPLGKVIGFGVRGQESSGASALYAQELAAISSAPRSVSVHNSYLQQLYDAGLVGALLFGGILIWATSRYAIGLRAGSPGTQIALPALLAAVMTGMTEVTLAPGYGLAPVYMAAGLAICVSQRRASDTGGEEPTSDQNLAAARACSTGRREDLRS